MTATSSLAPARPPRIEQHQLLGHFREVHTCWLKEARGVLEIARRADAGTWTRWSAIQYVNTGFLNRFERERAAVESLRQELGVGEATRLWAAAELIATLRWQLDHLVGACHRAADFATVTLKLEAAMEHWCREVEAALGQLTWSEVPEDGRQLLLAMHDQEEAYGT